MRDEPFEHLTASLRKPDDDVPTIAHGLLV